MRKDKSAEEVYDELCCDGEFEEANFDKDEIRKIVKLCIEDFEFAKRIKNIDNPNFRVVFNADYDVLRELCSALMRFLKQKTSSHQGVFAFIIIKFPELDLDFEFFETVRTMRNLNKYEGIDISKERWKSVEFKIESYIIILKGEIERRLKID